MTRLLSAISCLSIVTVGIAFGAASAPAAAADAAATPARPNVVVILADDIGFSDLGCYGSEIRTPNLDRLAAGGLRFTQFYNTGRCCPTRASLLTGLYPHQAGVGHMTDDRGTPGYAGQLNDRSVTIPQVLKAGGYGTYAVGKWHVVNSKNIKPDGDKVAWPLQKGFDRFYGTIAGGGSFYDPGTLTRDNTMISPAADPEYKPTRFYYTDAITDHAVRFVADHQKQSPDKPLFLYVAYTSAHWPMHALEEDVAKYKGKYDNGYEPIRQARLERMRQMGLVDPKWTTAPIVGDWAGVKDKAWEARCMEVYAAMIDRMDQGIGRVVEALRATGRLDDTLILYMQDNGGCQETVGRQANPPAAKTFEKIADDAVRLDVFPKQTRDGRPVRQGQGVMPGGDDTYVAYGENWANVSNVPFRLYKHYVHEGGISTPLVAHWPKGISRKGELVHQPGHLIDVMATCVDLGGAAYPTEHAGKPITPMEGKSLAPAFAGRAIDREAIYWEHEGNRAVRMGQWKLVAKGRNGPWELYDIDADRTETNDLSAAQPDRAKRMAAMWDAYAARANVVPWPGEAKPAAGGGGGATGQGKVPAQTSFKLKQGDALAGDDAPQAGGRAFTLTAEVTKPAADGVLVAQGGKAEGYALFVQGGRLTFAVRRGGKLTTVAAKDPLGPGPTRVTAALEKDGAVVVRTGDGEVASGKAPGVLNRTPADGLSVGEDAGDAVGPYEAPFPFGGTVGEVTLEIR